MKLFIVLPVKMLKRNFKVLLILFIFPVLNYAQEIDSALINYNFINSSPQNAEVFVNDKRIGSTPLYFMWADSLLPKILKVKLKGYLEESETVTGNEVYSRNFLLKPNGGYLISNPVKEDKQTYFKEPRKVFPIVISSVVTAVSGVAAYYFKSKASENQKNYDIYGDPAELDKKRDNNLLGNLSIIALQAGFGALMYFLFLD